MQKLFTSDKFFLTMTVLSCLFSGIYLVTDLFFCRSYLNIVPLAVISIACLIALYVSYRKHNKNVMKGMMGACLMLGVVGAVSLTDIYTSPLDWVCGIAYLVFMVALFINHFIINSDHHSRAANIFINQCLVLLIAVVQFVSNIAWLPQCGSGAEIVVMLSSAFYYVCSISITVCIESRLDAYRLDREAAGWTEEAGYPEGYVHEYQK